MDQTYLSCFRLRSKQLVLKEHRHGASLIHLHCTVCHAFSKQFLAIDTVKRSLRVPSSAEMLRLVTALASSMHLLLNMVRVMQHQQLETQTAQLQPHWRPTQPLCLTLGPQALLAMPQGPPLQV